jgi:hypothetical protein
MLFNIEGEDASSAAGGASATSAKAMPSSPQVATAAARDITTRASRFCILNSLLAIRDIAIMEAKARKMTAADKERYRNAAQKPNHKVANWNKSKPLSYPCSRIDERDAGRKTAFQFSGDQKKQN